MDDPFVGSGFLASAGPPSPLALTMRQWLPKRVYDPGEVYFYSNVGYGVLGALIEDVTDRRFEDYMRHDVLDPMGMHDSTFQQPLPEVMARRVVPGIERTALGFIHPVDLVYHRSTAGGGLTASVHDLIQLVRFVQGGGSIDGRQLLKAETMDRMLGRLAGSTSGTESFGFASGVNRGQRYWYGGGDLGGYHVVILWFPDHDRALVTTAAGVSEMATWGLVPDIMESWFGAEPVAQKTPSLIPDPKAEQWARQAAGIYRPVRYPHFDLAKTFTVTMDLMADAGR
jgi:CubicO group peptidase (beta-lactamase class C family)